MEKTITYWLTNVGGEEFSGKFGFPITLLAVVFVAWIAYEVFRRIVSPMIIYLA